MRKQRFSKPVISQRDYSDIVSIAEASKQILFDVKYKFLRDYLQTAKKSIIDLFVNNRIKKVKETTLINENSSKSFTTTREEQEHELSGQYKFIEKLLADLTYNTKLPDDLLKQFEEKKVIIEHLVNKKK